MAAWPSPSSLEEEGSDSQDSSPESEDSWVEARGRATEGGSWELTDIITSYAAPVIYKRGRSPGWELVPYAQLKELCKAGKDYGRGSPYFKNLLQVTFSAHTLVPRDIKNIMSCLLSPAEYMLWERTWKKQVKGLIQSYMGDGARVCLTIEHLSREDNVECSQDQAQGLPEAVLRNIRKAPKTALLLTPDDATPTLNFADIRQGSEESFIKFMDRLKTSIERRVENTETHKVIMEFGYGQCAYRV